MKKRLSLILCVVLLCQLLSGCGKTTETVREPDDAYRCYYEIFVGSFCDSDGDKCGDLSGITEKLDYIEDMGFTGIWLTPIMPSPTYHKYDVTDYYGIDPSFGTMEDFETLLKECHKRNIRLIRCSIIPPAAIRGFWRPVIIWSSLEKRNRTKTSASM